MPEFIVTEDAMRPASPKRECFYCQQPVGDPHVDGCVTIKRKVTVRAIIQYEIDVPAHWGKSQIEFIRNNGSWCADNMLGELEALRDDSSCLCDLTRFEFVEHAGEPFLGER